jgi:CBS domain-containing protein
VILPLLVAAVIAHGFTVLVLKRSILTEKVSRRGYHLTREYSIDPLEILFVREVMRTNIAVLPADVTVDEVSRSLSDDSKPRTQRLYPVVDAERRMLGVVTRSELQKLVRTHPADGRPLAAVLRKKPIVAYPDEPLRVVVYRMAELSLTRLPVVDRSDDRTLIGIVSLSDLLAARARNLQEEIRRERVLRLHLPFPARSRTVEPTNGDVKREAS